MKLLLKTGRTLLVLTILISTLSSILYSEELNARKGLSIKLGIDLPGLLDTPTSDGTDTDDMNYGFSGVLEYAWSYSKIISFGAGIGGQYPRSVDSDSVDGEVSFIDGYGLVNFILPITSDTFKIYTSLQLGWSYPLANENFKENFGTDTSLSGDLYWGVAAGFIIHKHYLVEFFYKAHHGEVEQDNSVDEFEYRHFGLGIGYQF